MNRKIETPLAEVYLQGCRTSVSIATVPTRCQHRWTIRTRFMILCPLECFSATFQRFMRSNTRPDRQKICLKSGRWTSPQLAENHSTGFESVHMKRQRARSRSVKIPINRLRNGRSRLQDCTIRGNQSCPPGPEVPAPIADRTCLPI